MPGYANQMGVPDFLYFPPQQGFPGVPGSDGAPLVWRGEWDETETYEVLDVVRYGTAIWICTNEVVAPTEDPPPVDISHWDFMMEDTNSYGNIDGGTPSSVFGGTEPVNGGTPSG